MSWFFLSVIALLCWSGSDLFSKIGCRDSRDKFSHFKMVTAVGAIMGLHALYEIVFNNVEISLEVMLTYLPVSLLYILSMALGYVGLKYIELSVSSPICNSSGALVVIATLVMAVVTGEGLAEYGTLHYIALAMTCAGVIGLGIVEYREDDELRLERQKISNFKYAKSWKAFLFPIAYCVIDAAGTFMDGFVLKDEESGDNSFELFGQTIEKLSEDSANVAYELTFAVVGFVCLIITIIGLIRKKHTYSVKLEGPKYIGAIFETVGQFAYIYAISDNDHFAMAAAIIASYCAVSVLWSRIFLKEKLSLKHYITIAITVTGIVIMGILDM